MVQLRIGILVVVLSTLALGARAAPSGVQFMTHAFPPLSHIEREELTGLCVDVVREIQRRTNIAGNIELVPWARGYTRLSNAPQTALFFVTRTPERESKFQWVGPLVNLASSFYAKGNADITLGSVADAARARTVIVHRGSFLEKALVDLKFGNLLPVDSPEDAVRMLLLQKDRDALMLLTTTAVPALLEKRGLAPDAIHPVLQVRVAQGYIAMSQDTPPEVVEQLQQGLDQMKRDGSFARLYRKWLPGERLPGLRAEADLDLLQPSTR